MQEKTNQQNEINFILAADHECGEISPDNDHIWEFTSKLGEPTALALYTTYGLRAYGMRVFPRFIVNKIPLSDPHSFFRFPSVIFNSPNFISVDMQPTQDVEINQKIWVPNSNIIVGQISLTNVSDRPVNLGMEWVAQLNPMHAGTPMTPANISINTVLQGQTQKLYPVFFLTGGPQGNPSGLPSLGIDIVFTPHSTRQFSWALATLNSTENSFFSARKYTAVSLDNEQIRMQMLALNRNVSFQFTEKEWGKSLEFSQNRIWQLILPAHHDFNCPSYITKRTPDQGYTQSEGDWLLSSNWGAQNVVELWELSQFLLPNNPVLLQGMLQNFLSEQKQNGSIPTKVFWNKKNFPIINSPLLAAIVVELFPYLDDKEWLSMVYPALVRSFMAWFTTERDIDQDGFPELQHLLQMGLDDVILNPKMIQQKFNILVNCAEWPSLAALLFNECKSLITIANWLENEHDIEWFNTRIEKLQKVCNELWNEKIGAFTLRETLTHNTNTGKTIHIFKQDGNKRIEKKFPSPVRPYVQVTFTDGNFKPFECKVVARIGKKLKTFTIGNKYFQWDANIGVAVFEEPIIEIQEISISGIKRGDEVIVGLPDFSVIEPTFMLPLWADILSKEQAERLISTGIKILSEPGTNLTLFQKLMWIKGLQKQELSEMASTYYLKWFLDSEKSNNNSLENHDSTHINEIPTSPLEKLLPLIPLMELLGISRITKNEIIFNSFNEFFPKVNVQYKQINLTLEATQIKVTRLNAESVTIDQPGQHRVLL